MLNPTQLAECEAAAQAAQEAAVRADHLAADFAWWSPASVQAAAVANAHSTHVLADVLATKLERWRRQDAAVSDADVIDFCRSAGVAANLTALQEAHDLNQTGAALGTIASDTATDAVGAVAAGATIGALAYGTIALLGVGGLAVIALMRRGK